MSAPGGVAVEPEDLDELVLDGRGVGEHAVGPGPAAVAGVEQDGFADAGELGEQDAHGQVQPGPGGAAAHEVGELEASTQVKTWTRMLCSVQWNIGLKEAARGSFI